MADWPLLFDGQRWEDLTTGAAGFTVTSHASANTKGTYVELTASSTNDASLIYVELVPLGATSADYLFDVAVGAAASEQVILENLIACRVTAATGRLGAHYMFPVSIPAGTRVAARCQDTTGGQGTRVSALLMSQSFLPSRPLGIVTTYGANTADSGGTQVDPGGTANTYGAFSEITSSTTRPTRMLYVGFGNQVNAARTNCSWRVDLAVGAGGSEQDIIESILVSGDAPSDSLSPMCAGPFPVSIPSGTRIAANARCDTNDATDRLLDVVLYGVS
jgi:hypothetical protein